jgi:hypothetical protein
MSIASIDGSLIKKYKRYNPEYTKTLPDIGKLRIWLIPYIINTNISINVEVANYITLKKNKGIIGISSKNRVENYTTKRGRVGLSATRNQIYHSFNVIVKPYEDQDIMVNITVFTNGNCKCVGGSQNVEVIVYSVKMMYLQIIREFPDKICDDNIIAWDHINVELAICKYIKSKSSNLPKWENNDFTEIKTEIKKNIARFNESPRDYDDTMISLRGMFGNSENRKYDPGCIIFGAFPTIIRAQMTLNYVVNCKKAHRFLCESGYIAIFNPELKSHVTIHKIITSNYKQIIIINPTGMVTFQTKTVDEMNDLYTEFCELFAGIREKISSNHMISIGESSESDDNMDSVYKYKQRRDIMIRRTDT